MPIQAPVSPLLDKSPGNTAIEANRIQSAKTIEEVTRASADSVRSLQRQIDTLVAAMKDSPSIEEFGVTGSDGGLIAWIGTALVGAASYLGAWFKQLYIGGTSAATAKIVADAAGNVTINGATISLSGNGTRTVINNTVNPWSGKAASLTSTDIATGTYSMVDPFHFALLDAANTRLGAITNTAGTVSISMGGGGSFGSVTVGGGDGIFNSTSLTITDFTARTIILDNASSSISVFGLGGTTFVEDSGVDAPSYAASGTPGINASDTLLSAVTPVTASVVDGVSASISAFVTGISVSTNTISYTPGASTATFVDGVGSSSSTAVVGVGTTTVNAAISITPTTQTNGYTKGLRTS